MVQMAKSLLHALIRNAYKRNFETFSPFLIAFLATGLALQSILGTDVACFPLSALLKVDAFPVVEGSDDLANFLYLSILSWGSF